MSGGPDGVWGGDMKSKRPFQSEQLRTRYRHWQLIVTKHACTGIRGDKHFELDHLKSFDAAMRAGKAEIDKREGPEKWDSNYTDGALR